MFSVLKEHLIQPRFNFLFSVVNCCGVTIQRQCGRDQFRCKNENKNQILSINDFNKEREKCIPKYYRCDGRSKNFCTKNRTQFSNKFLGTTARMEVMKMIVISVTSKSTKSLCELELCLNFKQFYLQVKFFNFQKTDNKFQYLPHY